MSVLALFGLLILTGYLWGSRVATEREARRRALVERALDKSLRAGREMQEQRDHAQRIASELLKWEMRGDPWEAMRREIEDLPEQRDANLKGGK